MKARFSNDRFGLNERAVALNQPKERTRQDNTSWRVLSFALWGSYSRITGRIPSCLFAIVFQFFRAEFADEVSVFAYFGFGIAYVDVGRVGEEVRIGCGFQHK